MWLVQDEEILLGTAACSELVILHKQPRCGSTSRQLPAMTTTCNIMNELSASCSYVNGRTFILSKSPVSEMLGLINMFLRCLSISRNGVEN